MHNVIVRFLACFIANKQKRRNFRKKYLHISYQKLINTVSGIQKSLENTVFDMQENVENTVSDIQENVENIVSDIQEKIKKIEGKLYKEPENLLINDGKNNSVVFFDENGIETPINTPVKGIDIIIHGNNNVLRLGRKIISQNSVIHIENDNAFVEIQDTNRFFHAHIIVRYGGGQKLCWGKGTTCWGAEIYLEEFSQVLIGEDCMLSDSKIRGSDGHSILDNQTGEIINKQRRPLIIENHVWCASGAKITKNAHIHTGSVVGANAVATKDYLESNVCIVGNPAKIVKRGITWDRKNTYYKEIEEKQNNNKVK